MGIETMSGGKFTDRSHLGELSRWLTGEGHFGDNHSNSQCFLSASAVHVHFSPLHLEGPIHPSQQPTEGGAIISPFNRRES